MEKNTVGQTIKHLRMDKRIRQKDLAQKLNVHYTTISNWESDRRLPSIHELKRIADFFNVSLDVFLDENEENKDDGSFAVRYPDKPIMLYTKFKMTDRHYVAIFSLVLIETSLFLEGLVGLLFYFFGLFSLFAVLPWLLMVFKEHLVQKEHLTDVNIRFYTETMGKTVEDGNRQMSLMNLVAFVLSLVSSGLAFYYVLNEETTWILFVIVLIVISVIGSSIRYSMKIGNYSSVHFDRSMYDRGRKTMLLTWLAHLLFAISVVGSEHFGFVSWVKEPLGIVASLLLMANVVCSGWIIVRFIDHRSNLSLK